MHGERTLETATLGGGCFWCLEAVYRDVRGVERVVSGYAGGHTAAPDYGAVCTGATGHAEVVQVTFDPAEVTYRDLIEVFFSIHDPTTWARQGADVGTQYRSVILWHDEAQRRSAETLIAELAASGMFPGPIVIELAPLTSFHPAEDHHQEYFARNPQQPYCRMVVAPKLAKFRAQHLERLRR